MHYLKVLKPGVHVLMYLIDEPAVKIPKMDRGAASHTEMSVYNHRRVPNSYSDIYPEETTVTARRFDPPIHGAYGTLFGGKFKIHFFLDV